MPEPKKPFYGPVPPIGPLREPLSVPQMPSLLRFAFPNANLENTLTRGDNLLWDLYNPRVWAETEKTGQYGGNFGNSPSILRRTFDFFNKDDPNYNPRPEDVAKDDSLPSKAIAFLHKKINTLKQANAEKNNSIDFQSKQDDIRRQYQSMLKTPEEWSNYYKIDKDAKGPVPEEIIDDLTDRLAIENANKEDDKRNNSLERQGITTLEKP